MLDEERLRGERTDRRKWKSRVGGLDEYGPDGPSVPQEAPRRQQRRPQREDEDDTEYRLALEASKAQEEEDRRRREGRRDPNEDDDLAKAIKLSKEEEEARRRHLEDQNAQSLFDDTPAQPQPTGWNQGYQQGTGVDFFGNPVDQFQTQPTGYTANAYTGFGAQPTGYQQNGFPNGFGQQPTGFDPYGQQQQPPQQQPFQPQPTGYNPYAQQLQPQATESPVQPGTNNPWATNNTQNQGLTALAPSKTGSNNPFAQQQAQSAYTRPKAPYKVPSLSVLNPLPEQKTLSSFQQPTSFTPPPMPTQAQPPGRELSEHEAKLNALLAGGDGQDTFGNVGQTRIPAQHTAPGTFVNSAGAGLNRLTAEATGNNPFLRQQYTGMPSVTYGGQSSSNPFGARPAQQQQSTQAQGGGDLIQF